MKVIRPKNWNDFQHYKDRSPGWIKLYKALLDDIEFNQLDAFACKVLVLFWLIASEGDDGWVKYDPNKIAFRMRLSTVEVATALETLIAVGFIVEEGAAVETGEDRLATSKRLREALGWGSRYVSDQVKREVWSRDGGACVSCKSAEDIEYDHIIPVSKGGSSETRNVQLLCRPCNRKKRTSVPAEHVATPAQPIAETVESREQVTSDKGEGEGEKKRAGARGSLPIPAWIPIEAWNGFVEMRNKIRAPLTAKAASLAIADLERLRNAGQDPGAVLEQSIMRSWRGLFPVEVKNDRGKSGTQQQGRGSREASDLALAAIKRAEAANSAGRAKQSIAGASDCIDGTARTISDGGTNPRALEPPGRGVSLPSPDNRGKSGAESSFLHRYETSPGMENQVGLRTLPAQREEQILPNSGPIARVV